MFRIRSILNCLLLISIAGGLISACGKNSEDSKQSSMKQFVPEVVLFPEPPQSQKDFLSMIEYLEEVRQETSSNKASFVNFPTRDGLDSDFLKSFKFRNYHSYWDARNSSELQILDNWICIYSGNNGGSHHLRCNTDNGVISMNLQEEVSVKLNQGAVLKVSGSISKLEVNFYMAPETPKYYLDAVKGTFSPVRTASGDIMNYTRERK